MALSVPVGAAHRGWKGKRWLLQRPRHGWLTTVFNRVLLRVEVDLSWEVNPMKIWGCVLGFVEVEPCKNSGLNMFKMDWSKKHLAFLGVFTWCAGWKVKRPEKSMVEECRSMFTIMFWNIAISCMNPKTSCYGGEIKSQWLYMTTICFAWVVFYDRTWLEWFLVFLIVTAGFKEE